MAGRIVPARVGGGGRRGAERISAGALNSCKISFLSSGAASPAGTKPARIDMKLGAKNAKRRWSAEEDKQLKEMVEAGKSVTLMALRHKRTVAAVRGRLSILKISVKGRDDTSSERKF